MVEVGSIEYKITAVDNFSDKMQQMSNSVKGFSDSVGNSSDEVARGFNRLGETTQTTITSLEGLLGISLKIDTMFSTITSISIRQDMALGRVNQSQENLVVSTDKLSEAQKNYALALATSGEGSKEAAKAAKQLEAAQNGTEKANYGVERATLMQKRANNMMWGSYLSLGTTMLGIVGVIGKLNVTWTAATSVAGAMNIALLPIIVTAAEIAAGVVILVGAFVLLKSAIERIMEGGDFGEILKKNIDSIGASIRSMGEWIGIVDPQIEKTTQAVADLEESQKNFSASIREGNQRLEEWDLLINESENSLEKEKGTLESYKKQLDDVNTSIDQLTKTKFKGQHADEQRIFSMELQLKKEKLVLMNMQESESSYDKQKKSIDAQIDSAKEQLNILDRGSVAYNAQQGIIADLLKQRDELSNTDRVKTSYEQQKEKIDGLTAALEKERLKSDITYSEMRNQVDEAIYKREAEKTTVEGTVDQIIVALGNQWSAQDYLNQQVVTTAASIDIHEAKIKTLKTNYDELKTAVKEATDALDAWIVMDAKQKAAAGTTFSGILNKTSANVSALNTAPAATNSIDWSIHNPGLGGYNSSGAFNPSNPFNLPVKNTTNNITNNTSPPMAMNVQINLPNMNGRQLYTELSSVARQESIRR